MSKTTPTITDSEHSPARLAALCRQSAYLVADPDAALRLLRIAVRLDDLAADIDCINQSSFFDERSMYFTGNISPRQSDH